jgi:hypothetical protein
MKLRAVLLTQAVTQTGTVKQQPSRDMATAPVCWSLTCRTHAAKAGLKDSRLKHSSLNTGRRADSVLHDAKSQPATNNSSSGSSSKKGQHAKLTKQSADSSALSNCSVQLYVTRACRATAAQ